MAQIELKQISLRGLFEKQLCIPDYQRTYSWKSSHVNDLLNDTFGRKSPYLMGTVILHEIEEGSDQKLKPLNIVDGQQRLLTLTVLLHELNALLGHQPDISLPLLGSEFPAGAAEAILNTRTLVQSFLHQKTDAEISAYRELLVAGQNCTGGRLQFTALILRGNNALDLAYTFFDSVNSKGLPLSDFDLLKAHHLMFVPPHQEALASSHNSAWQAGDENHPMVFGTILRRLRMWARREARDSKQERPDYNEFCSRVEPEPSSGDEHVFNRYMQPAAFRSWRRDGERIVLGMDYPMTDPEAMIPAEVTQSIEGGDIFFLYSKRYHGVFKTLFSPELTGASTAIPFIRKMAEHMDNIYLQNAFRAVMLLAFDKFGEDRLIEIGVCCERIISARRWEKMNLRIEGALDHIHAQDLIPLLLDSVSSKHVSAQLHSAAKLLPKAPSPDLSGVRKRYFDSMSRFYTKEQSKILDARTGGIASFYLEK